MLSLGRPVAVQLKVTLAPISMLWFRGTSTNSGARPIGKKYIVINIPFYYWDNLVWSQFHKQMTEERGNIFIITLLCHTRGWTAYTGTQKELFQANSSLPGCEPLPLLHSNYHHCFILFQKIILFSSSEEYVGFFFYSIAGTVFSDHPCIKQSLVLVFVGCQSPQFVSP